MRWIVHFGTPKTGSTALQETLFRNRRKLLAHGILYPKIGHQKAHHVLTGLFQSADKIHPGLLDRFGSAEGVSRAAKVAWEAVLEQIRHHKPATVILSSEMFVLNVRQEELETLKARLSRVSPEMTAALYVRSPAPYYLSALQQRVRSGGVPAPHPFEFRASIEALERVFTSRVIVRPFERGSLQNGDIVGDFFSTVVERPQAADGLKAAVLNETISAEAMSIILEFRKARFASLEGVPQPLCNFLLQRLKEIEISKGVGTRPKLRPEVEDAIVRASGDLFWLRERYGAAFGDVDYAKVGTGGLGEIATRGTVEEICEVDEARRADLLYTVVEDAFAQVSQLRYVQRVLPARQGLSLASKSARYVVAGARNMRNAILR